MTPFGNINFNQCDRRSLDENKKEEKNVIDDVRDEWEKFRAEIVKKKFEFERKSRIFWFFFFANKYFLIKANSPKLILFFSSFTISV